MTRRVLLVSHAVRTDMQQMRSFLAGELRRHGIEAVVHDPAFMEGQSPQPAPRPIQSFLQNALFMPRIQK